MYKRHDILLDDLIMFIKECIFMVQKTTLRDFYQKYPDYRQIPDESVDPNVWEISRSSKQKITFKCLDCGETYQAVVKSKMDRRGGCKFCRSKKVTPHNSLAVKAPHLAAEWSPDNDKTPYEVTSKSAYKAEWICSHNKNHTWVAAVSERNRAGTTKHSTGCPHCAKEKAQRKTAGKSQDDLLPDGKNVPQYMKDMLMNKNIQPTGLLSTVPIEWKCEKGHTFWHTPCGFLGACPECNKHNDLLEHPLLKHVSDNTVEMYAYENQIDSPVIVQYTVLPMKKNTKIAFYCAHSHKTTQKYRKNYPTCHYCKNMKNTLKVKHPELYNELSDDNTCDIELLSYNSAKNVLWECSNGHTWSAPVYQRVNSNTGCPHCSTSSTSAAEQEVSSMISSWGIKTIRNTRSVISPYELDIYIPDKNIGIEYNGLYWHSDSFVPQNYHYDKWKLCKDHGIQLIAIWEDDWHDNNDIVVSMLRHKLGVDDNRRVYARNTQVHEITYPTARDFLDEHHIQGACTGSIYYGLVDNHSGDLVAVSVWRKQQELLYLDRYATSCIVVGGLGKLLTYGKQYTRDNYISHIVTFSDHEVSDGGLYKTLGFVLDKEIRADYSYIVNHKRVHKFNYRKNRFRDDPDLLFDPDLSESQLASLNEIQKVYDYGKTRWIMDVN